MKKIFHSHPNLIITALVLIFLILLIWLYSWAINDIFFEAHAALTSAAPQASQGFDLAGAAKLNLRGLVPASESLPVSALAPASASLPATAATTTTTTTIQTTTPALTPAKATSTASSSPAVATTTPSASTTVATTTTTPHFATTTTSTADAL